MRRFGWISRSGENFSRSRIRLFHPSQQSSQLRRPALQELLEAARVQAERMVQRTEVVRAAESRARQISEAAESDARRLHHETEDFLDQRLASFEILLDKLSKTVHAGRARLAIGAHKEVEPVAEDELAKGFFDQDR